MSDNEERQGPSGQRPNANYRLSRENADSGGIVYHYDRERRLAKAPQSVKDLYKNEPTPKRFNLLRPLINTKPKIVMFASIIVCCLAIMIVSFFGLISDTHNLGGNELSIQAIRFEGTIIVAVEKTTRQTGFARFSTPYTGAVDIAVSPAVRPGEAVDLQPENFFHHRVFFTLEPRELFRFSVPFHDSQELAMVFQTERNELRLSIRPE